MINRCKVKFYLIKLSILRKLPKMSTLPELFRPSKSVYIKPNKQGGIFSLKISNQHKQMDHNLQPQISNNNLLIKKYSESRVGTSCTTRTNKTRRTSSFICQRPYSRQSGTTPMYDVNNYGCSRVSFAIMENAQMTTSEADSLHHLLQENLQETNKIQSNLEQLKKERNQMRLDMKQMREYFEKQCDFIKQRTFEGIMRMRNMLSTMRRQTGTQTKVNKGDADEVSEAFEIVHNILDQIDELSASMQQQYVR